MGEEAVCAEEGWELESDICRSFAIGLKCVFLVCIIPRLVVWRIMTEKLVGFRPPEAGCVQVGNAFDSEDGLGTMAKVREIVGGMSFADFRTETGGYHKVRSFINESFGMEFGDEVNNFDDYLKRKDTLVIACSRYLGVIALLAGLVGKDGVVDVEKIMIDNKLQSDAKEEMAVMLRMVWEVREKSRIPNSDITGIRMRIDESTDMYRVLGHMGFKKTKDGLVWMKG